MKKNVGQVDRILRLVAGALVLAYGIATGSWIGAVGVVLIATGFIRWCPAYCPLGISTDRSASTH